MINFIQVDDLTATAGQPSAEQFEQLRDAGFDLVINLAPDGLPTSLPGQTALLESLGLEYRHIPVLWGDPLLEQLDTFTELMDRSRDRRKLVHCQMNMRVTAFYSLYAMDRLGWTAAQADALRGRVWTQRPGTSINTTWQAFIAAAERRIAQAT